MPFAFVDQNAGIERLEWLLHKMPPELLFLGVSITGPTVFITEVALQWRRSRIQPTKPRSIKSLPPPTSRCICAPGHSTRSRKKDAATLEDAIRIADAMGTTPDGRRAMVYAITPEGRAALVPATMIEQARRST